MKYTFINKKGNQQTITIPDDYITSNCINLNLTKREAIDMYLSDEGYITNPVVTELTEKASGTKNRVCGAKKKRERKPDLIKRSMIAALADFVREQDGTQDVEITNVERIVRFALKNDIYEITLSRKRKPKE